MASTTFDTHEFVRRLRDAGMPEGQAEALAEAQRDALAQTLDTQMATKADVSRIELKRVEQDGELKPIIWTLGLLLAGVLALVLKAFFP
jgi:hypothetical protein